MVANPKKTEEIIVTKEDISGSSDIVNLAYIAFVVHRCPDYERLGEMAESGGYKRGKEPIKYERAVEVLKNLIRGFVPKLELFFDYPSYRFYRTQEEEGKDINGKKPLTSKTFPINISYIKFLGLFFQKWSEFSK